MGSAPGRGASGKKISLRFTALRPPGIEQYLGARPDLGARRLFVSHAGKRPSTRGDHLSPNSTCNIIRESLQGPVGLPAQSIHITFRHWRATQMTRQGVPIDQVRGYLNYWSIRTTQRYAKTADQVIDQAGAGTDQIGWHVGRGRTTI